MSLINPVNVQDGNIYLVNSNEVSKASDASFDYVFNEISSDDDNLETIFKEVAEETGVDVNLLKAVAQAESGFDTEAVSSCGAQGIMQLMPFTSESLGVTDPFDARQNIMGGAQLLSSLLDTYDGNVTLALAGYNAGSGAVGRYGGVPPYKETINYINRINDILGGALENDSTTIDGSSATDLSGVYTDKAPDVSTKSSKAQTVNKNNIIQDTDKKINDNSKESLLLSYEDYMYVMNTYKEIVSKLLGTKDNTMTASDIYETLKGNNRFSDDIEVPEERTEVEDAVKSDIAGNEYFTYNATKANVNMLQGNEFNNILKNDAMSIYQAQASVISPIVAKLLDL